MHSSLIMYKRSCFSQAQIIFRRMSECKICVVNDTEYTRESKSSIVLL